MNERFALVCSGARVNGRWWRQRNCSCQRHRILLLMLRLLDDLHLLVPLLMPSLWHPRQCSTASFIVSFLNSVRFTTSLLLVIVAFFLSIHILFHRIAELRFDFSFNDYDWKHHRLSIFLIYRY
jgi:hypothetical protein